MEIQEYELEKERSGSWALYVSNELMDLYAVTYQLEVPKLDGSTSFIGEMM